MRQTSLVTSIVVGILALFATCSVIFCWTIYYPYHKMREENYRKELRVLQDLCESGLIPPDFQINSVTFGGKATNCSQAIVYTQIPIIFGAISDMWDDSLIKFVINGGNWKIQVLAAFVVLFAGYHLTRTLMVLLCSSQIIDRLPQASPGRAISTLLLPAPPVYDTHESAKII